MEDKKSLNELSNLSKLTERMVDLLESDISTRRADKAQERKDKIQMSRAPSNRSETETRHDKDMLSYTRNSSEANAVTSKQEITRHKESELSNKSIFTTLKTLVGISVAQGAATLQSNSQAKQAQDSMDVAAKDRKTTNRRDSKMFHGMLHMAEQNYVTSNQISSEIVKLHSFLRDDSKHELKARLDIMKADRHFDLKREQRLNNLFGRVMEQSGANLDTQGKLREKVDLGEHSALVAKAMLTLGDNLAAFDEWEVLKSSVKEGGEIFEMDQGPQKDMMNAKWFDLNQKYGKEFNLINEKGQKENKQFIMGLLKKWGFTDVREESGSDSKRSIGIAAAHEINQVRRKRDIEAWAKIENMADGYEPGQFDLNKRIAQTPLGQRGGMGGGMGDCCDTLKDIYNEIVKHSDILQQSVVGRKSPLGRMVGRLVHGGGEKFSGSTEGGTGFTGKTKGSSYTRKEFGELKGNPELLASMFDEETAKAILDGKVTFNETSGILRIKTETGPIDTTDSVANELAKKELKISTKSEARDVKRERREEEIRRDSLTKMHLRGGGVTPFGGSFGRNAEDGGDSWYDPIVENPELSIAALYAANEARKKLKELKKNKNKNKNKMSKTGKAKLWAYVSLAVATIFQSITGDDEDSGTVNADTGEVFDEGTLTNTAINAAWTGVSVYEGYQLGKAGMNRFKNRVSSPNFVGPRQPKKPSTTGKTAKSVAERWKQLSKKYGGDRLKAFVAKRVALLGGAMLIPGLGQVLALIGSLWTAYEIYDILDEFEKEASAEDRLVSNSLSFDEKKDTSSQGALNRLGMAMEPEHQSSGNGYSQNYSGTLIAGMPVGDKLTKMQYEMMKLDKRMGNTHSGSLNDKFNAFKLSEADLTRIETPDKGLATDAATALKNADDGPNNSLGVNIHNWEDSPFGGTRNSILDAVDNTGLWGWVKDGIKTDVNTGFDGLGKNPSQSQVEELWKSKSSNLSKFGGETESSIKSIYASEFKKFFGTVLGGIGSVLWGSNAMAGDIPYDPAGRGHGYDNDPDGKGFWDKGTGKKKPRSKKERDKAAKAKDKFRDDWNKRHPNDKLDWPDAYQPEPGQGDLFDPAKMNQANQFAAQMVNLSTRYSPKGQMFPLTMMNHGTNSAAQIKANGFQSRFANAGWAGKNMFYGSPGLNVAGAYGGQNIPVVANAGSRRIFGGGIGANGLQFGDEIAMGARGMNQGMDLASRLSNHPNSAMAQRLLKTGTTSQASKLLKLGGRAFPGIGAGLAAWDAKARYDKGDMLGSSLSAGSGIPIAGLIPLAVQLVTDYLGITGGDNSSSVMDNYVPTRNLNPANEGKLINGGGGNTIINNTTNTTSNNSATDVIFSTNAHAPALPPGMVGYGS